jgi:hypothetical protein
MNRDITINYSKSDLWWKTTLEDLWVTILEGGSNYWVDKIDYDDSSWLLEGSAPKLKSGAHLAKNFEVTVYHGADEFDSRVYSETVKVKTFDVIHKGISLLSDDVKTVIMNNGDWDANDADHIFQLGVFGEVRYG